MSEALDVSNACHTCCYAYKTRSELTEHHGTKFHRYNIGREVCKLKPLKFEEYNELMAKLATSKPAVRGQLDVYCKVCQKKYANENSYENHSKSRKHIEQLKCKGLEEAGPVVTARKPQPKVASAARNSTIDERAQAIVNNGTADEVLANIMEQQDFNFGQCLFCEVISESLEENLKHMAVHYFTIPDIQYCEDIDELFKELQFKVISLNMCLYCDRMFDDLISVQKHMVDKAHMSLDMRDDKLLEYSDYYDYSSTYPDADEASLSEEAVPDILTPNGQLQLVLPSGTTISHKALTKYCKVSSHVRSLVPKRITKISGQKLCGYYRSLGIAGATKAELKRRAADIRVVAAARQKQHMRLGIKTNKFKPHFRVQIDY